MSAFPPQRSITSIPVTQDIALKYLSAYLKATQGSPHLLPNARLEPSGPTAGFSNSSITIHNLRRVEAGLRGEWLSPTLSLEENKMPITDGMDDGTNKRQENLEGDGWMDLDEYQREQSIEGGELRDDDIQDRKMDSDLDVDHHEDDKEENTIIAASDNKSRATTKQKAAAAVDFSKTPIDKDATRAEKKARLKEERKLKHKIQTAS
ncbi:hypothetical protein PZA11_000870 [Diplocarpon coronariae]|uniref:Uncharacterized protein n=1 Tax=Diplocarpon coronariae TaxID=2795749 RepID=A0A218ZD57_9HELO|nr:hypothetical protein JHW43_009098 [Diplocarpon mali]OWP05694.1 hypothetical protein B2J93_1743 [Marssonina coronariae]